MPTTCQIRLLESCNACFVALISYNKDNSPGLQCWGSATSFDSLLVLHATSVLPELSKALRGMHSSCAVDHGSPVNTTANISYMSLHADPSLLSVAT